jgi:hypothetical protein
MLFKHKAQNEIMLVQNTIHTLMTICLWCSGANIVPKITELISFLEYVIERLKQIILENPNQMEFFTEEEYQYMELKNQAEIDDYNSRKLID